jgi:hypothetical protein
MENEIRNEEIEAYLDGTMSVEDRFHFEERLQTDADLRADVALHRDLSDTLSDPGYLMIRQSVADVGDEMIKEGLMDQPRLKSGWRFTIILSALFLLILALWWWRSYQPDEPPTMPDESSESVIPKEETPAAQPVVPTDTIQPMRKEAPAATPSQKVHMLPNQALDKAMKEAGDPIYALEDTFWEETWEKSTGKRAVLFNALVKTAAEPAFKLEILDNSNPAGKVLHILPVVVTEVKDGDNVRAFASKKTYALRVSVSLDLKPGLYYSRLISETADKPLWMYRWIASEQ